LEEGIIKFGSTSHLLKSRAGGDGVQFRDDYPDRVRDMRSIIIEFLDGNLFVSEFFELSDKGIRKFLLFFVGTKRTMERNKS